jgi:hypothetical protein
MTATNEATVPRTTGTTMSVIATETVATTNVNDAAAMMMRPTNESANANANATGPGRLRSMTEGDYNERLCA